MSVLRDLRTAFVRLRKSPRFTLLSISTLALAIGAQVAVFSLVDAVFLRPLPLPEPDRLVGLYETRGGEGFHPLSLPDVRDYAESATVFSEIAAHYPFAPLSLRSDDAREMVNGSVVSPGYFSVLRVEPARGRFFASNGLAASGDASAEAIVSHHLWQTFLRGRDDILGQVIEVNSVPATIVGVAPQGFRGVLSGYPSEIWISTDLAHIGYRWCDATERDCKWLTMIGRLADEHTLSDARAESDLLGERLRRSYPLADDGGRGLVATPLRGTHPRNQRRMLRLAGLLGGGVTLVLVVAGLNLGGLLLARNLARRDEIAVRLALGAGRRHVVGLCVAETLLLSVAGGASGLLLVPWLQVVLGRLYPADQPLELAIRSGSLAWAALVSLVLGLAVGLFAALRSTRRGLSAELQAGPRTGGRSRPKLLAALVVGQISLSFVLVVSTTLLAKSLDGLDEIGGLDATHVATLRLRPRLVGKPADEARRFQKEVIRRLSAVPGVESASLSKGLPPFLFFEPQPIRRAEDSPHAPHPASAWTDQVTPGLFDTLRMPLLRGRDFGEDDTVGSPRVAVVSETVASTLWPEGATLGRRLVLHGETFDVVGVVRDVAYADESFDDVLRVYTAFWQNPDNVDARATVRTTVPAGSLLPALREAIRSLDAEVPITEVETMSRRLRRSLAPTRLAFQVLGASAILALSLTMIGLYGLLTLVVGERRREIGIRTALGGDRHDVVALVLRDATRLLAIGLGIGLLAALGTTRTLARYLYAVDPYDAPTFGITLLILAAVGTLAIWHPAQSATSIDPVEVLREE